MRNWLTKLFWVLVAVYFALVVWSAFALPDRVPMHWSGAAGPDEWGSRTAAVIMLTGLGLIMVAIFGTLLVAIPRSRSLTWVNLPHKAYWQRPENLPRAVDRVATDLAVIGALTMAMICAVPVAIVAATSRPDASLPGWALAVIIGWLVLLTGYLVWMVAVRWRVPRDA
ncbi:hypothetical protein BA895_03400 [Humibacillus sp. DSM 29435]|uniref:DUF1648 domain-containing protein n=1 Tax=Humibacillus sp. DSM 29435 TaxID=1869167 RepID=UPI0008720AB9|nr:DUF1648 domain-containing protein [Humibacillus sp. DSM 29435]OFE16645.1 hypothetical protein BA895_03400 [Humibacillus sp. DSM 29435]